jgi:16S rRNA (guanine966-N2)-methyltransferase
LSKNANQFQIIGGDFRGRKFNFPEVVGLRPTPNKVRETLFNWLQFGLRHKVFLDLFAGSGALGFEAVSRGAKRVISVEKNQAAFAALQKNSQQLKTDKIHVIKQDALTFLTQKNPPIFDFILLDPPFHQSLLEKILPALLVGNFLVSGCKIYVESEFKITADFLTKIGLKSAKINQQKTSSQVFYCLIEV